MPRDGPVGSLAAYFTCSLRVHFATPRMFDSYRILPHTEVVDNKKAVVDKKYQSTIGDLR